MFNLLFSLFLALPLSSDCSVDRWWLCPAVDFSPYKESRFYKFSYLWTLGDESGIVDNLKDVPSGATFIRIEI